MTTDEKTTLRAEILAVLNPAKAEEDIPLPAGTPRAAMTWDTQERAFSNWQEHILSKPPHTWDTAERNAIRVASTRALRTL
jgi:hypothetical protein